MNTRSIPLEQLQVNTPCTADWSSMAGDDQHRFCTHCKKHVHRLAAMRRSDAENLVCESGGTLCAILEFAPTGELLTLDYAPARRLTGWQRWRPFALVMAALATSLTAVGMSRVRIAPPPAIPTAFPGGIGPRATMGDVAVAQPIVMGIVAACPPNTTQPSIQISATQPTATQPTAIQASVAKPIASSPASNLSSTTQPADETASIARQTTGSR